MRLLTKNDLAIMFVLGIIMGFAANQLMHESYSCDLIMSGLRERHEWTNESGLLEIIEKLEEEHKLNSSFWERFNSSA